MSVRTRRLRTRKGGAMIGLVISILFFILFLGLFAFDANRAQLCQREMIAACDSASITGTAMLASYDTSPNGQTTLAIAQQLSAGYAYNMFTKSVVLGRQLSNAVLQASTTALYNVSAPDQCNVIVALGDPDNNFKAISYAGDPTGRTVMVFACYGYQPEFLSAMPFAMKVTPLSASSFGGLPQVDAVVVFDYSGSMDDFTSVLFVRREWWWPTAATNLGGPAGTGPGMPLYSVVTGAGTPTNNLFSNYLTWNYSIQPAGSGTNVLPPQQLQAVGSGNTAVGNPLSYTNALRANPIFCAQWLGTATLTSFKSPTGKALTMSSTKGLNSYDYGQPPGNFKAVFVLPPYSGPAPTPATYPTGAGVVSLTPDHNKSDTSVAGGNGYPCFWWNHRGNIANSAANMANNSPITGSIMNSTGVDTQPASPNAWAQSLYTPSSPTATYHAGYPPNFGVNNSVWTAVANDLQNENTYFTDMVCNLVDPTGGGSEYMTQPIPAITASTITNFYFSPFAMTFPTDEADARLAGKSFNFYNLATVVEAARGNLDNANNFDGACIDGTVIIRNPNSSNGASTPLPATPTTTTAVSAPADVNPFFQLAYERVAMLESQPYATAADGAENGFFYKLSTLADTRFGFVGFSAVTQTGNDNYGAPLSNCLNAYAAGKSSLPSQGTATGISELHSGVQYYYNTGAPSAAYYYGTNGTTNDANDCWYRANQKTNITSGSATTSTQVLPYLNEAVWGYQPPASTSKTSGAKALGFKVPRTQLSTNIANANQLSVVASHETGGAAPYNALPYGDIWSSTASNGYADGVWNGRPMTDTYCDEALSTAYANFSKTTNTYYNQATRLAARKAIVFFTDGEPTGGLSGQTATNSTAVATLCQKNEIACFTIGLNMDPKNNGTLTNDQYAFLGDGVNASYTGSQNGLAYTAGNGSRFFQCQDGSTVRSAFASIARRLAQAQF